MGADAVVIGSILCVVGATVIVAFCCLKAVKLMNETKSQD